MVEGRAPLPRGGAKPADGGVSAYEVPYDMARPPASWSFRVTSPSRVPAPMVAVQVRVSMEKCCKCFRSTTMAPSLPSTPAGGEHWVVSCLGKWTAVWGRTGKLPVDQRREVATACVLRVQPHSRDIVLSYEYIHVATML